MADLNPGPHNQWYPFADRPLTQGGAAVNPAVVPLFAVDPLPQAARYVVVGAGIHGLSTAWHLAMRLQREGRGTGRDVVLIDKQGPGAGATGLACGCIRNLYMTGPLHAILRESVAVWQSDPINFGFQQVGYVSVGEANQEADYIALHASQNNQGYPSDLYVGAEAKAFLKRLWPDFKTANCDVVLHEKPSGYAGTHMACWGLDQKCRQWGVQRVYGPAVLGYGRTDGRVTTVHTDRGDLRVDEAVVIAAGAWMPEHWGWLGHPDKIDVHYPDGHIAPESDMWTYWRLLEGEVFLPQGVDFRTAQGRDSPVLHVELMNTPVPDGKGGTLQDHVYWYIVDRIQHMAPIGQLPEFTGKARDAPWCSPHHKYRATPPVRSGSCPSGPVSRPLGASTPLTDAKASLSEPLLPRNRDTGSYGYHMLNSIHWIRRRAGRGFRAARSPSGSAPGPMSSPTAISTTATRPTPGLPTITVLSPACCSAASKGCAPVSRSAAMAASAPSRRTMFPSSTGSPPTPS